MENVGQMRRRSEAASTAEAGTRVPAPAGSDVGQSVRVAVGEKMYQPIRFHGFRVGPFEATGVVLPGETVATAALRIHAELMAAADEAFRREEADFYAKAAALIAKSKTVVVP